MGTARKRAFAHPTLAHQLAEDFAPENLTTLAHFSASPAAALILGSD
jgi:hypothetical protein